MLRGGGPAIAQALAPRMAKVLEEGEEMPDVAHLLYVLGRLVLAEVKELGKAEDKRIDHDRYWAQKDLKRAARELRERVADVRKWLRNSYSAAEVRRRVKFKGRTPRGTEDLADLATIMVRYLPDLKPRQGPGGDAEKDIATGTPGPNAGRKGQCDL